jgi:hypothetical protein
MYFLTEIVLDKSPHFFAVDSLRPQSPPPITAPTLPHSKSFSFCILLYIFLFLVPVCLSILLIVSPTLILSEHAATLLVQSLLNHLKTLWSHGNHVESRPCVSICTTHVNFTLFYTPAPSCFLSKHIILMCFNISTCLIFLCIYKYLLNWTPNGLISHCYARHLKKHNKASWNEYLTFMKLN